MVEKWLGFTWAHCHRMCGGAGPDTEMFSFSKPSCCLCPVVVPGRGNPRVRVADTIELLFPMGRSLNSAEAGMCRHISPWLSGCKPLRTQTASGAAVGCAPAATAGCFSEFRYWFFSEDTRSVSSRFHGDKGDKEEEAKGRKEPTKSDVRF